jgi:hypothetical protein
MKKTRHAARGAHKHLLRSAALIAAASLGDAASAMEIDAGPDWTVRWDNTVSLNLGVRAQKLDDNIGNHPVFAEADYSHAKRGDVVTSRLSDLMEFDAQNKNGWGARASASFFKDFAFHDHVRTNPGEMAPGTPYSAIGAYTDNEFSSYTKRYYKQGAQLLDAFAFSNFKLGERDASAMAGRLTKYWGNAVFFGPLAISYSQNAVDNIKGSFAPGTEAKELAIPREQLYLSGQVTRDLAFEGQYFFRFKGNLLPEGGTYLSFADFLTNGPQGNGLTTAFGLGPHGEPVKPKNVNANFGLKLSYAPSELRGAVSAYYRQLDETQPWMPMLQYDPATFAAQNYHLSYAQKVKLLGFSMEKQLGAYSVGAELVHRHGTALNSTAFNPIDPLGREGARGNATSLVFNTVGGLTRTSFWDTGVFLAEVAYTHLDKVTSNAGMYNGVDNAAACPSGSKKDGCSTRNALMAAVFFKPQWLAVRPSIDLGMPIFVMHGITGNAPTLGVPVNQGVTIFTLGLEALIQQKYTVTLQYNGYHAPTNGKLTNAGAAFNVPNGTPGFPTFYAGGSGTFMYNDKGWVSLTLKASF